MKFQELKNQMLSSSFIVGHKIRVKTLEEIDAIDKDANEYDKFDHQCYEKYIGREFVSSKIDHQNLYFYIDIHADWRFRDICINLKYIDFTEDNRKPSEESISLAHECVLLNKHIYMSTRGESHGGSESALMTSENTYPVLDIDGKSVIHFPVSGYSNGCLQLNVVKSLLNNEKVNRGVDTGMSYIPRDLIFYTEEESAQNHFSY